MLTNSIAALPPESTTALEAEISMPRPTVSALTYVKTSPPPTGSETKAAATGIFILSWVSWRWRAATGSPLSATPSGLRRTAS